MCGLYGYIGFNKRDYDKTKLSQSLFHRGPDDGGELLRNHFMLGFRRLSIIDLSRSGHQPMTKTDTRHICFNGEIYNYKQLRKYLTDGGRNLQSTSDTEVLLQLLIEQKEKCLHLLNGMFSFVFVDEESGEFIIARDRLGVKPLYYSVVDGVIYFASELPALLGFELKKEVNLLALNRYIHFGHITPPLTIYKNIFKLEPGHFIKGSLKSPEKYEIQKWWDLLLQPAAFKTENTWIKEIDDLLADAVKVRLIADVPVGLFLSGGIDSSLIAYYSGAQSKFRKPKAFSVTFDETDYSELEIAKVVAEKIGLELLSVTVKAANVNDTNIVNANIGEPFSDSSLINQYYLSEEAKKYATVFLTGDGGDEAFAGYNEYVTTFRKKTLFSLLGFFSRHLHRTTAHWIDEDKNFAQQLSKLSMGYPALGKSIRNNFNDPILGKILNSKYKLTTEEISDQATSFWNETKHLSIVKRMQYLDYKNYLEPDVLVKVDRATMSNSIEARSPFLDYRLVELAFQIQEKHNISGGCGKQLLRKLAEKHLPPYVTKAPKKGFGLPMKEWITDESITNLKKLHKNNNHDFFDEDMLSRYIFQKFAGRDVSGLYWRIKMFEEWYAVNMKTVKAPGR